jgi:hypothetical protein
MFAHVFSSPNDNCALLFDVGNKLIGSLDGLIHIFDQTVNLSFQGGKLRP